MTITDQAIKLTRAARDALGRAATLQDPTLSDVGLADKRAAASRELRQALALDATQLRNQARRNLEDAQLKAAAVRPKIADDAGAAIRNQQRWDQVRGLLESGRDIRSIISNADLDTLLAVETFAPMYLQAQNSPVQGVNRLGAEDQPVDISRAVTSRMIAILPDFHRLPISAAQNAEDDLARATPYLDFADGLATGGATSMDPLGAAVASQLAVPAEPTPVGA